VSVVVLLCRVAVVGLFSLVVLGFFLVRSVVASLCVVASVLCDEKLVRGHPDHLFF
jgi:hypothetical protein